MALYHPEWEVRGGVHGDDFVFAGLDEDLDKVAKLLAETYEIKNRGGLGSGPRGVRQIDILGRIVKLHEWAYRGRQIRGTGIWSWSISA